MPVTKKHQIGTVIIMITIKNNNNNNENENENDNDNNNNKYKKIKINKYTNLKQFSKKFNEVESV